MCVNVTTRGAGTDRMLHLNAGAQTSTNFGAKYDTFNGPDCM